MLFRSKSSKLVDPKSDAAELRKCFGKVVPGFDSDKVYTSDIKKMFIWFELVKDFVALPDEGETTPEENPSTEPVAAPEEVAEAKPKKAPRKKAVKKTASDEAE